MNKLVDQHFQDLIDSSIEILTNFSVPLYLDIKSRPTLCGTGFFVKKDGNFYLVSAAHVLDESLNHGLYYYTNTNVVRRLSGRLVRSKPKDKRSNDHIDIGVVKMTGDMMPPYLDVQKYAMDYSYLTPAYIPRSNKHYSFIGFPATKSKVVNSDKSVRTTAYAYKSDSIPDSEYSTYGVNENTHIVLPLDLKKCDDLNGQNVYFPKPQGMSGSPVVVLYEAEDGGSRTFPVVAVAIEYRKSDKVVIATDVKYVIEAIENAT